MSKHRVVLGSLYLGLGIMSVIGMVAVLVIFFLGSAVLSTVAVHEPDMPRILVLLPAGFGLLICFFIALSAIPNLIGGYGLLANRPWSEVVGVIAAVLNLPAFPLGTAVGVYAIWVFLQKHPGHPEVSQQLYVP